MKLEEKRAKQNSVSSIIFFLGVHVFCETELCQSKKGVREDPE